MGFCCYACSFSLGCESWLLGFCEAGFIIYYNVRSNLYRESNVIQHTTECLEEVVSIIEDPPNVAIVISTYHLIMAPQRREGILDKIMASFKKRNSLTWFRKQFTQGITLNPQLQKEDRISWMPIYVMGVYSVLAIGFYNIWVNKSKSKLVKASTALVSIQVFLWVLNIYGKNQVLLKNMRRENYLGYYLRQEYYK